MTSLKEQAIKAFNKVFGLSDDDASGRSSVYVKKAICTKAISNGTYHLYLQDFDGIRGNSNAFWEATIKWCPVPQKTENEELAELWEAEIDTQEAELAEESSDDLDELNEVQDYVNGLESQEEKDTIYVNGWARYSFDYTHDEWQEQLRLDVERKRMMRSKDNEFTPITSKPNDVDGCEQEERIAIQSEHLTPSNALDWEWELNIGAITADIDCEFHYDNDAHSLADADEYKGQQMLEDFLAPLLETNESEVDGWDEVQKELQKPLTEREQKTIDDHYDLLGRLLT